ncbi:peptide chain release factor 3 [Nesterenkonia sp. K-15-9-6]|uniref:peptide chain release factor 3 n=1 Tax=Nesterenkonia sp. K-15-9-6 TaxID=3093918 RepID=UPI0040444F53
MTAEDHPAEGAAAAAARRRTFAIISHPDAGKSTLTESLALNARAIEEAGHIHGKAGRSATVSDWMGMEKDRGISISSASMQLEHRGTVLNLLDTPGHADFSEDTYRVLAAVDAAVMLIDAAKGLEPQTMKLFNVCRHRGIPIITVINKWDRPGLEALELIDEIREETGLDPTPVTWPVGIAGDFHGYLERRTGGLTLIRATPGGRRSAEEEHLSAEEATPEALGLPELVEAREESELLGASGADHDQETFLAGISTPVFFAAAVRHLGVPRLLDALVELAPSPEPRPDAEGEPRSLDAPFSAFTFKIQSGMDAAHRDRLAFVRVSSGVFRRGMTVTSARTGRPFSMKYAHLAFGRTREVVDVAYPGDVVGIVNASALRIGDTLYEAQPVEYPPLPRFAPEHFAVARPADMGRMKQFRRGVEQLEAEGVIQVLRSEVRGTHVPVLAAVGPMQFEVVDHRLREEFRSSAKLEPLEHSLARATDEPSSHELAGLAGVEVLERSDGQLLALFRDRWHLLGIERTRTHLRLDPLVAA